MNVKFYLLIASVFICYSLSAQKKQVNRCSASEIHQQMMAQDPVYKKFIEQKRETLSKVKKQAAQYKSIATCVNPIIIPVAVHYEGISNQTNQCLEDLALSQIDVLNADFSASNTDASNYCDDSDNTGLDEEAFAFDGACIQFCLADQNHPTGFGLNNGDYAITINEDYVANGSFPNFTNGVWSGYLNIFVTEGTGVLGYAPVPGSASGDGVVIEACVFGTDGNGCGNGVGPGGGCVGYDTYNEGRTTTHEVGHYLGLGHMWGENDNNGDPIGCSSDDDIADTPNSDTQNFGCPTIGASSTTCGSQDMYMNFMDYVDDACMYMFSEDQSVVMNDMATSINFSSNKCSTTPTYPAPAVPGGCGSPAVNISSVDGTGAQEGTDCIDRSITFEVSLSKEPSNTTIVDFTYTGTAVINDDYTASALSLIFTTANWSTSQTITVDIIQDAIDETDEELVITISSVTGSDANIGSDNTVSYTLQNDDSAPSPVGLSDATIFSENFEGAFTWSVSGSGDNTWAIGTAPNINGTSLYISRNGNAYSYNNTTSNSRVFSPAIDASTFDNLTVEFNYRCEGERYQGILYDYGQFSYSLDGINWVDVGDELWNQSTTSAEVIDLPAAADNASTLYLSWIWINDNSVNNQPPLSVDDVVLKGDQSGSEIQEQVNSGSGFAEHDLPPNETVHFYDQSTGNIMCTIANQGHDFGCTRVEVVSQGSTSFSDLSSAVAEDLTSKTFLITPETNDANAGYEITLYYTAAEIDGFTADNATQGSVNTGVEILAKGPGDLTQNGATQYVSATPVAFGNDYTLTGTFSTGFSGFSGGDNISLLPVEWLSFDATRADKGVLLTWKVIEQNNEGFYLSRKSQNQDEFELIEFIKGVGSSSEATNYSYIDENAFSLKSYYYRIEQVDFDGKSTYSRIVSVSGLASSSLTIMPNPARTTINVIGQAKIAQIFNTKGELVYELDSLSDNQEIAVADWVPGIYVIVYSIGDELKTEKIVINP